MAGFCGDTDIGADHQMLPPVQHADMGQRHGAANGDIIAQWRNEMRRKCVMQARKRPSVEMIVMIMGDQYHIDGRQVVQPNSRRDRSLRSGKCHRTGPVGPDRICQNIESTDLDQHRGMADHGDPQILALDTRQRPSLPFRQLDLLGPASTLTFELPAHDGGKAEGHDTARIEKTGSIKMVGNRTAIIGIFIMTSSIVKIDDSPGSHNNRETLGALVFIYLFEKTGSTFP